MSFLTLILGGDPYCIIECEGEKVYTKVCHDTLNPEWNQSAVFYRRDAVKKPVTVTVSIFSGVTEGPGPRGKYGWGPLCDHKNHAVDYQHRSKIESLEFSWDCPGYLIYLSNEMPNILICCTG